MDEDNNGRKKRRRSMRTLRRQSEILPVNLLAMEDGAEPTAVEGKLLDGNAETFGSLWYESQEPVKERRRRRSNMFAALPPQIRSEIEEEAKTVTNEMIDCIEPSENCLTSNVQTHIHADKSEGEMADKFVINESKFEDKGLNESAEMSEHVQSISNVEVNDDENNKAESTQNNSLNAGFFDYNTPSDLDRNVHSSCESSPLVEETSKISPSSMSPDFPMSPTKLVYSPGAHEESYIRKSETSIDNIDMNECVIKDDSLNYARMYSIGTSNSALSVEFDHNESKNNNTCTNTSAVDDKDLSAKDSPGFFSVCKTVAGKVFDFVKTSPSYLTGAVFSANNSADLSSSPALKSNDSTPLNTENLDISKTSDPDNTMNDLVKQKIESVCNDNDEGKVCSDSQSSDISSKSMLTSFIEQLPDVSSKMSVSLTASARKKRDWTVFNDTFNAISKELTNDSTEVVTNLMKDSDNVTDITDKCKSGKELFKSKTEITLDKQGEALPEENSIDNHDTVIENVPENNPEVKRGECPEKSLVCANICQDMKNNAPSSDVDNEMEDCSHDLNATYDVLSPLNKNMDGSGNNSLRMADTDSFHIENIPNNMDVTLEQSKKETTGDDLNEIKECHPDDLVEVGTKTASNVNDDKLMMVKSEIVEANTCGVDIMNSAASVVEDAELQGEKIVDLNKSSTEQNAIDISDEVVAQKEDLVSDKKKARRRAFGFLSDKKESRVKNKNVSLEADVQNTSEALEKVVFDEDSKLNTNDDIEKIQSMETKLIDSCQEKSEQYDTIEAMKEFNKTINKINKIKRKYTRRSGKFNTTQMKNISTENKTSDRFDLANDLGSLSSKEIGSELADKQKEHHPVESIPVNIDEFVAIKDKNVDESSVTVNGISEILPQTSDDCEIKSENVEISSVEIIDVPTVDEKVKCTEIENEILNSNVNSESVVPKKRGRRKSANAFTSNVEKSEVVKETDNMQTVIENLQPKKRGRPKSTASAITINVEKSESEKVNDDIHIDNQSVVKKKRGRRKSADAATLRVGLKEFENDNFTSDAGSENETGPLPKKRVRRKSADTATLKLTMLANDKNNENGSEYENVSASSEIDTENIAPIPKKRGRRKSADTATLKLTMLVNDENNENDNASPEVGSENIVTKKRGRRKSADTATLKLTMLVNDDSDESFNNENNSKRGRKRKIIETMEDVEKLYMNKNYVKPEENKAWQTIVESPAKSAEVFKRNRLHRYIDFEKPSQMKLRRRCQRAVKNGWDWQKWADSELDDEFVKSKLANLWQELDGETQSNDLRSKLQNIVDTE
ncbi:hypothetical protein ACF0H5_017241 [Mactra antiquata]